MSLVSDLLDCIEAENMQGAAAELSKRIEKEGGGDRINSDMEMARWSIDEVYGPGFHLKHPELIGAYLQASAIDNVYSILQVFLFLKLQEMAEKEPLASHPVSN